MLQYFETLQDESGNAITADGVGTVIVTAYPGGALAPIYSTNGTASPITGSVVTADVTGQVSFYIPDGAYILTYQVNGTTYKTKSPVQMIDPMSFVVYADSGSANAYAVNSSALPLSLYAGLKVEIQAGNANTGGSTFNLNGTGNQAVVLSGGSILPAGAVLAKGIYRFEWDAVNNYWQLIGSFFPPNYPQTLAEIAAGVTPVNFTLVAGQIDRYFNNVTPGTTDASAGFAAALAQALQAGGAPMTVNSLLAITQNVTLPIGVIGSPQAILEIVSGTIHISTGVTLTINCPFEAADGAQVFVNALAGQGAVMFGEGSCKEAFFEWWGARADWNSTALTGTDNTAMILAGLTATSLGLTVGIIPMRLRAGYYLTGSQNGSLCPVACIRGVGRTDSGFVCKPGTTGIWWQENAAGAAKIILEDLVFEVNNVAGVTWGVKLGYVNVNSPHGTEGYLRALWVRDCPGGTALDVKGNVGFYDLLSLYSSLNLLSITGTGNMVSKVVAIGGGAGGTSVLLNGVSNMDGLHIEAPAATNLPLSIQANCNIVGCSFSGADGVTINNWVTFGANASSWGIEGITYYFGSAQTSVVTNGNMLRSDGSYFGSNATGTGAGGTTPHTGEGNYYSEVQGQRFQAFTVRLINTAGVLQHRICDPFGIAVNCAGLVNNASASLTNTPTGTDATTAFAAGAKISTAQTNVIIFDVPNQRIGDFAGACGEVLSTTGVPMMVIASNQSFNVNGVTRNRLNVGFYNKTTGAAVALNTTNVPSGDLVQVQFAGYIGP